MKRLLAVCLCTALAVSFGCNEPKSTGGPGTTGTQSKGTSKDTTGTTTRGTTTDTTRDGMKDHTTDKDKTFTITAPSGTTDIKQGQSKEITISINRGKELKQDVKLTLTSDDKGVMVEPDNSMVKASDDASGVKFTLKANKDAAIGEHKIHVKATAESGPPAETEFKVKVSGP